MRTAPHRRHPVLSRVPFGPHDIQIDTARRLMFGLDCDRPLQRQPTPRQSDASSSPGAFTGWYINFRALIQRDEFRHLGPKPTKWRLHWTRTSASGAVGTADNCPTCLDAADGRRFALNAAAT
jgi:hypothetical protein